MEPIIIYFAANLRPDAAEEMLHQFSREQLHLLSLPLRALAALIGFIWGKISARFNRQAEAVVDEYCWLEEEEKYA